MNAFDLLQIGVFLIVVVVLVKPVGAYLERVFEGRRTLLDPVLLPVEDLSHRLIRLRPEADMSWQRYALAFGLFGVVNTVALYFLLRGQASLPWFFRW